MSNYVVSLDSRRALRESLTGGKGANLARLRRQGFTVPPGFVITAPVFAKFLAHLKVEDLAREREWTESELAQLRERVMACAFPSELAHPILRTYQRLGGQVAVRSSMIGEDRLLASFAGQLDSVLNVQGPAQLLAAVRCCWASLFNWRLAVYWKEHRSSDPGSAPRYAIAVLVQRMVDARAAGVAFSADPVTGQRCVTIEAVQGLGDALVQGLVEPDRYTVDGRGVLAQVSPANPGAPILASEQILRLAHLVRDVTAMARDPQDVEWAWDGSGFHILQARPITSLVGQRIYSNRMVADMSPGLIKPLVYSTNTLSMAHAVFGRAFTQLIGPNSVDYSSLTRRIHSRIYTDLNTLGELFERLGLPPNFFEMMSRDERANFRRPPLKPQMLRAVLRLGRFVWRNARVTAEIDQFIDRHRAELEPYRTTDWSTLPPAELLAWCDRLLQAHRESQWYVFIGPMNMMVRSQILNRIVGRRAPDVVPSDLLRGLVGRKAIGHNDELRELAAVAGELGDEIEQLLMEQDDAAIRATLSTSEQGRVLVRSVDQFLERWGFLSANATDFSETPWIDKPVVIWQGIARAMAAPQQPDRNTAAIREQARARARARLNPVETMIFDRLLASTAAYADCRERMALLFAEDSYHTRLIFLVLADRLVEQGKLDRRDDIFYLAYEEVGQIIGDRLRAEQARALVVARRSEMEADAQLELPDTICGERVPSQPALPADETTILVGIRGSSGRAQGYARVIADPARAPRSLGPTDILVVPFTDVSWTPLFSRIGGVVAETGGQLSHTSIVAREYGLPAVVSVRKATRLIRDGQPITVDGTQGRVYLTHLVEL